MDHPTKIMVPVDFSRHSAETLRFALKLGQIFPANYLLLHVVPFDDGDAYLPFPGPTEDESEARRRLQEAEKELQRQKSLLIREHPELKVEIRVRTGVPFREICRCAEEENVRLIVIGTHGRTGLSHLLIGSTAERVVQHASCPVLTIKPHIV